MALGFLYLCQEAITEDTVGKSGRSCDGNRNKDNRVGGN